MQKNITIKLPEGRSFTDLKLRRCSDDAIDLDMDLIEQICYLNEWDFKKVCADPGPVISTILTAWYKTHLAEGGAPDNVMEDFRPQGQGQIQKQHLH